MHQQLIEEHPASIPSIVGLVCQTIVSMLAERAAPRFASIPSKVGWVHPAIADFELLSEGSIGKSEDEPPPRRRRHNHLPQYAILSRTSSLPAALARRCGHAR